MRAHFVTPLFFLGPVFLAPATPAQESRSANFRNLSAGAATSATASIAAPTPRAEPVRTVVVYRPAPAPAAAVPASATAPGTAFALWALSGAGAALAFAAAFAASRRRARRPDDSLALAAHELKSPLSAIESYLALMEQDGRSGGADARAWLEDVGRMRTTAAHLRRTIGDMLEMTRLEDGRLRLEARAFDLGAVARESAASYGALALEAGVTLSVRGEGRAWGDPSRVRQILDNLIGNALRHVPAGGTVAVNCAGGARPAVSVADDGPGVPVAARGRLFTRFARLSEPARGGAGTGLGLYIGRRLAEASGGRLDYAPGPGERGAVFTLTLPEAAA